MKKIKRETDFPCLGVINGMFPMIVFFNCYLQGVIRHASLALGVLLDGRLRSMLFTMSVPAVAVLFSSGHGKVLQALSLLRLFTIEAKKKQKSTPYYSPWSYFSSVCYFEWSPIRFQPNPCKLNLT